MAITEINREIINLWHERFGNAEAVRWPLIYPELSQNGLTVIGCNPALPDRAHYEVPYFNFASTPAQVLELAKLESSARETYIRYFGPSLKLAGELDLKMAHVDLFFYRESNQRKLLELILNKDGELNDFGRKQVDLAVKLMALTKPRILLVANAFAGGIFKKYFGLHAVDAEGLYWATLADSRVPVFLSGMLSGGHLDNHARERLVWHMKRTLSRL